MPGDGRSTVMTDDDRRRRAERVEDADHVADEVEERVLIDGVWLVALAIAAQVWGDGAKARRGERGELMSPGTPGFREAVAEEDERPDPGLGEMDGDPVRLHHAMGDVEHEIFSPSDAAFG